MGENLNLIALFSFQTWFFTDLDDADIKARTGGHLVVTNCTGFHTRTSLACKMAAEFEMFISSHKR